MSDINPIDRMFDALAAGNLDAARATFTPDARIWHSFDCVAHDLDGMAKEWSGLIAVTQSRGVTDVRRQAMPGGFVQQHIFHLTPKGGGDRRAWAVCVVVRIENGRIARLDEYIDRAGSFAGSEEPLKTPGL